MLEPIRSAPLVRPAPAAALPVSATGVGQPSNPMGSDHYVTSRAVAENRLNRRIVALVLRALSALPLVDDAILAISRLAEPVPTGRTVPNFGIVAPGIWRGGLPSRQGYETLARQGLRTVVNLAAEHPEEAGFLPKMGIRYVALPMHPFRPPTMAQAFRFLSIVLNPANGPVYVHCYHGKDRTGAMIAVYRIAHDGWTAEQAIAEMRRYGLHEDMHEDKVKFVRQFEQVWREPQTRDRYLKQARAG